MDIIRANQEPFFDKEIFIYLTPGAGEIFRVFKMIKILDIIRERDLTPAELTSAKVDRIKWVIASAIKSCFFLSAGLISQDLDFEDPLYLITFLNFFTLAEALMCRQMEERILNR